MNQLQRPLVLALLCFLAGLLPALRLPVSAQWTSLFLLGVFASYLLHRVDPKRPRGNDWLLYALFIGAGGLTGALARIEAAEDCRAKLRDGAHIEVGGVLHAAHRPVLAGNRQPILPFRVFATGASGCTGELRIRLSTDVPPLAAGAQLQLNGTWRSFPEPVQRSAWPADPRYHGYMVATDAVRLTSLGAGTSPWLSARARADEALARLFPQHLELAESLLLGRREYLQADVRDQFARAGLTHLLAISGSHVGFLACACFLVAAACRLSRKWACWATLLGIWVYLLIIGAPPSAVRAGIMITLALLARLLQRPSAALPMIAAAALAILAAAPLTALDAGLQLSFAGVLGILLIRPALAVFTPEPVAKGWLPRALTDSLLVGAAAFLTTAPVAAHHFGVISPISVLAGVPAIPLSSLALMGAVLAMILLPLAPALAETIAAGAALALDALGYVADLSARLPYGSTAVAAPPWGRLGAAAGAALLVVRFVSTGGRRLRWIVGSGAALAFLTLWPAFAYRGSDRLEVHFIDVGQGDAVAIRTPARRWVLFDAGPAERGFDAGARRVLPFLRAHGARRLEALVLTHPHLDHLGGASAVLRELPVAAVIEPGLPVATAEYLTLLDEVRTGETEWRAARTGRTLTVDGVRFDFLWPDAETIDGTSDPNQISAVVRVSYGDFDLLLPGDISAEIEEILLARDPGLLAAEVLKLGHHGSATSTSEPWLEAVGPELAVVSAGRGNPFGHPDRELLGRLEARGIQVARTDREGSISLMVGKNGGGWTRKEP